MRLWHEELIPLLPRKQLLGQHRECCALRGNGWGRKHATVDYVFQHSPYKLYQYHQLILTEMKIAIIFLLQNGLSRSTVGKPVILILIFLLKNKLHLFILSMTRTT